MRVPAYRTARHVLRPETGWPEVAALADELSWPLVYDVPRDRAEGLDGHMIWESPPDVLPAAVSLHYTTDQISGVGYVTLAGDSETRVTPYAERMERALRPWRTQELLAELSAEGDDVERGKLALRLGLSVSGEYVPEVSQALRALLRDPNDQLRYVALWATSFTEYGELLPDLRALASGEPEEYVRERAAALVGALEEVAHLG
ncbi:HEAT repeat domain-containing protein [Streptomyces oceani]|uniref:HEAT repeat domain-containing protein n=1 Tax=Streptomyces oceani TaxID=1075402 RepID=A0A1E7JF23_9ACTN|nr:HEAT repeat domain-containing protein [Streptomyces oceani]OEU85086.1 hypothetical protein AN216_26255 [Streptomyces oceani]